MNPSEAHPQADFETCNSTVVTIEHEGRTARYRIHELSAGASDEIFSDTQAEDPETKRKAVIAVQRVLINRAVRRMDGTAITVEQATNLPVWLARKLQSEVLIYNGLRADPKKSKGKSGSGTS